VILPFNITEIAIGDMDMDVDRKLDIVLALNVTGHTNMVVLYQSSNFQMSGSYQKAIDYLPLAVKVGNFTGTARPEIALVIQGAEANKPRVMIYQWSTSTYTIWAEFNLYNEPINMVEPHLMEVGDLNQDGLKDLVIGDSASGRVAGFPNPGNNSWGTNFLIARNGTTALMLSDLDGDGALELVIAERGIEAPILTIWDCSPTGFTSTGNIDTLSTIDSLTSLQLNEDARREIIAASTESNDLTVYKASTSGPLLYLDSIRSPVPRRPVSVAVADLNEDEEVDLVLTSCPSDGFGAITIYYQSGDSLSNANDNQPLANVQATASTVGDLDGDGAAEVIVYDVSGPYINFAREGLPGIRAIPAPDNVTAVECLDLNGDGYDDLAMISSSPRQINVWYGNRDILSPSSPFYSATLNYSMSTGMSMTAGDLDGDRDLDLAIGGDGSLDIFWNSGTAVPFSQGQRFTLTLSEASVTSMTCIRVQGSSHNDSLVDLALVNASASRIEIYFQQQGAPKFVSHDRLLLNPMAGIAWLKASDLSGDGREDLLTSTPHALHLYVQDPNYTKGFLDAQPIKNIAVPEKVRSFSIGDLDDNGGPDIALVTTNSTIEAYKRNEGGFILLTRQTAGASPAFLSLADMDGDDKSDIVVLSALSCTISFYYQNNFAPVAKGEVEGSGHLEGVDVWFNAYGSTDSYSDRGLLNYSWDFTDGSFGYGIRVSHKFQNNRTYDVVLNVTDPSDASDEVTIRVIIEDRRPTADFTFQPVPAPVEGSPVTFTDLSTTPVDPIVRWEWDFGDGTVLNRTDNQPVQHIFGENGAFTVTLTVFDKDGSSNSVEKQLTVLDSAPDAAFSVSDYRPIEGQEVTFRDWSNRTADAIKSWSWDFGDGTWANVSGGDLQHHAYLRNGAYSVTLVVVDIDGSEDSITKEVVVLNSVPVADFEPSLSTPNEGQQVSFVDASTSFNPMVRWSWDMGDGTWCNGTSAETVLHMYRNNGTYIATLTVEDSDGDGHSISKPIIVRDTSPTIVRLYTMDGGSSYREWDNVSFGVVATPGWEDISVYQWDFQTTVFQADEGTALNSTYHRFLSPGPYKVTVRVWDTDSYAEAYIMLTITDPAPVPDFTATVTGHDRNVSFSAALTVDTENDVPILKYRWFFGDGNRTDWSSYFEVDHTYQQDGVYSVRLEVRDDHNSAVMKTKNVTIDLLPPEISIDAPVLRAVVGEPTLIKVRVTDLVGVRSVILEYTFENATRSVAMTPEGGGIYFAQVPAQNRTGELTYRVTAVDKAGHASSTEWFTVALEYEDPTLFIVTTALLLIALLIVIAYLVLTRPIVDEVFVMYQDGTLLAHQTRRLKPGMDDEILGGMLIALQSFVRDSFKDEGATVLKRMDFGDRKLLVERKDGFFMAVVLSGKRAGNSAQRMRRVLDRIEERYADVLRDWDGDLEKVRGIRDETKLMFQRTNPLERLRRREGDEGST